MRYSHGNQLRVYFFLTIAELFNISRSIAVVPFAIDVASLATKLLIASKSFQAMASIQNRRTGSLPLPASIVASQDTSFQTVQARLHPGRKNPRTKGSKAARGNNHSRLTESPSQTVSISDSLSTNVLAATIGDIELPLLADTGAQISIMSSLQRTNLVRGCG